VRLKKEVEAVQATIEAAARQVKKGFAGFRMGQQQPTGDPRGREDTAVRRVARGLSDEGTGGAKQACERDGICLLGHDPAEDSTRLASEACEKQTWN
jgi:hypothetical protein